MLNVPIGSFFATSKAAPVAQKFLPSDAFFDQWLSLVRYSSFSASSIRMFMNGDVSTFSRTTSIQTDKSGILFPPARRVNRQRQIGFTPFRTGLLPQRRLILSDSCLYAF